MLLQNQRGRAAAHVFLGVSAEACEKKKTSYRGAAGTLRLKIKKKSSKEKLVFLWHLHEHACFYFLVLKDFHGSTARTNASSRLQLLLALPESALMPAHGKTLQYLEYYFSRQFEAELLVALRFVSNVRAAVVQETAIDDNALGMKSAKPPRASADVHLGPG